MVRSTARSTKEAFVEQLQQEHARLQQELAQQQQELAQLQQEQARVCKLLKELAEGSISI